MSSTIPKRSSEEQEAASIVANLHVNGTSGGMEEEKASSAGNKRSLADVEDDDAALKPAAAKASAKSKSSKKAKKPESSSTKTTVESVEEMDATARVFLAPELKPAPYFYYSDHSLEEDPDPLIPITVSGHVPTFPAKMHAILTNPNLTGIVAWNHHGRSWTILEPRAFEVRILPKYFEHSKFSSFVRQANGWGFRRLSAGNDRNTFYHEYFLRGMPWLVKKMRRPKVNEKKSISPDQEPGFDQISKEFPVPDRPLLREILVMQRIMEKGAKARMPVNWDLEPPEVTHVMAAAAAAATFPFPDEEDQEGGVDGDLKPPALPEAVTAASMMSNPQMNQLQQLAAMHQMNRTAAASLPPPPAANNADDSGFAAGFLAATAYHNRQVQNMLGNSFMSSMPPSLNQFSSHAAGLPSSPNTNRFPSFQGNDSSSLATAAMMGGPGPNMSSNDFALAQLRQQAAAQAPSHQSNVSNDMAVAQQLQIQAYQNFINGGGHR